MIGVGRYSGAVPTPPPESDDRLTMNLAGAKATELLPANSVSITIPLSGER